MYNIIIYNNNNVVRSISLIIIIFLTYIKILFSVSLTILKFYDTNIKYFFVLRFLLFVSQIVESLLDPNNYIIIFLEKKFRAIFLRKLKNCMHSL